MATAEDEVSDPEFKINAKAIHIDRRVEMYQWEEDQETRAKKKAGGGETRETTHSCQKKWSDDLIRFNDFKRPDGRENLAQMPFKSASSWPTRSRLAPSSLAMSLFIESEAKKNLPYQKRSTRTCLRSTKENSVCIKVDCFVEEY